MVAGLIQGIIASNNGLIATDTTKTYNLDATFDENRYYLNSLLHQNPTNKNTIVNTFSDGVDHTTDAAKKISGKKSTDRGATYGAKYTIYDPAGNYQVVDPGIGYDRHGKLHIMADCHDFVTPAASELRYMTSTDDGATVSAATVIAMPSDGLDLFRMYGKIIEISDGVLLAPAYRLKSDYSQSARYCLRSDDGGATWTWIQIALTTTYINETEFLAVTDQIVFAVSRNEVTIQFTMYKSTDAGLTWVTVGDLGTGLTLTVAAPCRLHKFRLDNGTQVAAMYFVQKGAGTKTLYAMYGRLDVGIEGGRALFKNSTLTTLTTNTVLIHYGDLCHYNGNMNAKGAYVRETNNPTDNEMIYFESPATHYTTVFNLITPITIYDRLAGPDFIATYRGLVSNTSNDYGVVNASDQITTLKGILPGSTSRDFTATAGGITLSADGIEYAGTKALTHATANNFNYLSYSSLGYTDVNWTFHWCGKMGVVADPNTFYGFFGNNGASAGARGICVYYEDRSAFSNNNALVVQVSKGSAGFIIDFKEQDAITPNTFLVLTVEVDLAQASQDDKVKVWVNGVQLTTVVTTFNTTVASNPTYNAQIGTIGNNSGIMVGTVKDVVIQNYIDLPSVRTNFIQALMELENIS